MSVYTIASVKTQFPDWEKYVKLVGTESAEVVDARLQQVLDDSESEMSEYMPVSSDTLTGPRILHLLNIVRKRCFDIKHGATAFETKPQIVRDYEWTRKQLEKYRAGQLEVPLGEDEEDTQKDVYMNAPGRKFDDWF